MKTLFAAFIIALLIAGFIGSKRQIGFWWSLAACFFLSPLIGLIITLCSEKLPVEEKVTESEEESTSSEVVAEDIDSSVDASCTSQEADDQTAKYKEYKDSDKIDY